jgi:hypothetical protein
MFESYLAECYLHQQEERIASDAERHRILHLDRPGPRRTLIKLVGRLGFRQARRGTVRVTSNNPSLSTIPEAAAVSSSHPSAPNQN